MPDPRIDLPQGTLDLLILRTLALEPQHGWAISERIHQVSSKALFVQQGSLYPALHRLERKGWIKARWGASERSVWLGGAWVSGSIRGIECRVCIFSELAGAALLFSPRLSAKQ